MQQLKQAKQDIETILNHHPQASRSLIPLLQEFQNEFGYLPEKVMKEIADYLDITPGKVYSVATFYAQFRFEPLGDHLIRVCHGTACHVKGANRVTDVLNAELGIELGETTSDGRFTMERVACLGCCSLAPVMMVDDTVHGNLTRDKVQDILKSYREE